MCTAITNVLLGICSDQFFSIAISLTKESRQTSSVRCELLPMYSLNICTQLYACHTGTILQKRMGCLLSSMSDDIVCLPAHLLAGVKLSNHYGAASSKVSPGCPSVSGFEKSTPFQLKSEVP